MSFKDAYTLTEEQAKKVRERLQETKNRAKEADVYDEFTQEGKPYFLESIDLVEKLLTKEIMKGKLGIDTTVLARIKDRESALNNDDLSLMNKNTLMKIIIDSINKEDYTIEYLDADYQQKGKVLDDVFGITIMVETEEEKKIVEELIKSNFILDDEKRMKTVDYKAVHLKIHKEKNPVYPLIECQIKTRQESIESREHTIYKVESIIERKLRQSGEIEQPNRKVRIYLTENGIKKVHEVIQQYFNDGLFTSASNVPKMWESRFNESKKKMDIKMLSEWQALKRKFKFLDMNAGRDKEGEEK